MIRNQLIQAVASSQRIVKPKVWLFPDTAEREYTRDLVMLIDRWVNLFLSGSHLGTIVSLYRLEHMNINDSWGEEITRQLDRMAEDISRTGAAHERILQNTADKVDDFNRRQWNKIVNKAFGINVSVEDNKIADAIDGFINRNVSFIKDINNSTSRKIEAGIREGLRDVSGINVEKLTTIIEKSVKSVKVDAARLASNQVRLLNSELMLVRQTSSGIERYYWRTSHDERVRRSHRLMDGRLCVWSDSRKYVDESGRVRPRPSGAVLLHPGMDYHCRCYPEPDFYSMTGLPKKAKKTVNVIKSLSQ